MSTITAMARLAFVLCLTLVGMGGAARADFPDRAVRIIVQVAAGSSIDISARIIADRLARLWGQQVVVFNQPGAGGAMAVRAATAAPADGYTLLMAASSIFVVLPELQSGLDIDKLEPIGFVSDQPMVFAVDPKLGVTSLPELIAYAKAQPGGINCGVITRGGLSHLTGEWFRSRSGADMTFIYYPGTQQALNDVTAGRVPLMVETLSGMLGAISGGLIKPVAVAYGSRLASLPDTATASETLPGFIANGWLSLVAPPGTPAAIVEKLSADLRRVVSSPDVAKAFAEVGSFTRAMSPGELADHIRREQEQWRPIIRQVGLQPQ